MNLDNKLIEFDNNADKAVSFLIEWLEREKDYLIIQARGRLIRGHYTFADKFMYELDEQRLLGEASEEMADAINYISHRLSIT